ncbi:DUF1800 domain-containing protein [Rivibacter subsaxonicus]|uniref:Uncharacterized protein (DUF1800 family) n=1 Tax=Rivibacter subsaxonicus TaxID=457575 RepID=A0A4Q7VPB2_9BURK|nr:DUF1800 domain-containing protein [Rivibacter subsaxonicus]RZT98199.1 uncharacterized protein (DUF1800 family) [Rivibacter subsaxonicus]
MPRLLPPLMRPVLGLVLLLLLAAGWACALPVVLDEAAARHLLLRTGFAPTPGEVRPLLGLSPAQAVDRLLAEAGAESRRGEPRLAPPAFTREPIATTLGRLSDEERKRALVEQQLQIFELRGWWLQQMTLSPAPLAERMTLFWHNHFATSQQKVRQPQGMWIQHRLLRREALGDFGALLHGIARDPAMLVYLDGASNRDRAPNENFAREVMELFTLGEGHYGERDIKEAARAFSGWTVDRADWQAAFRPRRHDHGVKTVLGRSGRFDGDAVLDILLAQPAAPPFVAAKLWREFVSPEPSGAAEQAELERVARRLGQGWQIAPALRELLLSEAFWAEANRAALIKSPVELVVGSFRQFGVRQPDGMAAALMSTRMGQALFMPPNVKGWPGYTDWIDANQLLERRRFAERLLRGRDDGVAPMLVGAEPPERMGMREMAPDMNEPMKRRERFIARLDQVAGQRMTAGFDAEAWLARHGAWPDREPTPAARAAIEAELLAAPAVNPVPAGTTGLAVLRALALDPAYQLK